MSLLVENSSVFLSSPFSPGHSGVLRRGSASGLVVASIEEMRVLGWGLVVLGVLTVYLGRSLSLLIARLTFAAKIWGW